MAFYQENEDEQQDPNQAGGIQTSQSSGVIGADGSTGQGASPSQPKAANSPDKPGNFVGIQQYINANKPQASKLGDQTAGVINNSALQAQGAIQGLTSEASEKIKPVASLSDDVKNKINSGAEVLNPEERRQIKSTTAAQYQGPQQVADLQSYQSAADATNKANQNIENSGTEEGRMNLISQVNTKPRTQGMNVFDNALLSAGGGREKLAQAAQANAGVKDNLLQAQGAIQGQIGRADDPSTPDVNEATGAIGQTNAARDDAYKTVNDALTNWKSAFQPRVQQAQQDFTGLQQRVTQDIADNPYGLDQETLQALGLGGGERLFNLNLNDYINPGSPSDINASNVATSEDYARYGALADLAGETNPLLDQANIGQAGKAPKFSANSQKLRDDIMNAMNSYNNKYETEKGGILNNSYLSPDLSYYAPMQNATAKELQDQWLPYFQNLAQNPDVSSGFGNAALNKMMADGIRASIEEWQKGQGYTNVATSNQSGGVPNLPTNPDGSINWGGIEAPTGGVGKGGQEPAPQDDFSKKKRV